MALRFFVVPVHNSGAFEQELNGFLAGHKVVSVDRQLIDQGVNSFWAICVEYLSHAPGDGVSHPNLTRSRVDCKAILPPEEFAVFSRLRELRKELSQGEAVPVYELFTNEQVPRMVPRRCRSNSDLTQVEWIGETKVNKHAERLLPLLQIGEVLRSLGRQHGGAFALRLDSALARTVRTPRINAAVAERTTCRRCFC